MCKDYEKIIIFFLRFLCHTLVTLSTKTSKFKHNLTQTKNHQYHRITYSNKVKHKSTKFNNISTYGLITRRLIPIYSHKKIKKLKKLFTKNVKYDINKQIKSKAN